jgi:hypothetical protein
MKKLTFLLLFYFGLIYSAYTQAPVNIIKIVPQSLPNNTLKISLEHAASSNSKASINISPFITLYDRKNEQVYGAGLELAKKIYVSKIDSASPLKGFYGAASISYAYYSTHYKRYDDSTTTSTFGYQTSISSGRKYSETIHQVGADIYLGYQFPIKKVLYVDIYLGGGLRYSFSSQGSNSYYTNGINDYAYTGIIPKAGIKIGLKI